MYRKTKLDNGITVISEFMPQTPACALGFWFATGTRWDPADSPGLAHFAEHMFFKGTKKRSAWQLAREMDILGGRVNAFTEQEQTCFHIVTLGDHLERAFELLTDMLLNSLFDPEELEREKNVVCEEIKMVEDSLDELASDLFYQAVWPNHPLGKPIQGTVESVSAFDVGRLREFCRDFYRPERLIISAAGKVGHEALLSLAERYWSGVAAPGGAAPKELPGGRPAPSRGRVVRYKSAEQVNFCCGGPGLACGDPRYYALWVLDSILGDSLSCRLFQEIREKCGLAYSIETFRESYLDCGLFGVEAAASAENVGAVLEKISHIFAEIRREGVSADELRAAKEHRRSELLLGSDSASARMERLAQDERFYGRYVSLEEVCGEIDRVSCEDVHRLAREILNADNYTLAAAGPAEADLTLQPF